MNERSRNIVNRRHPTKTCCYFSGDIVSPNVTGMSTTSDVRRDLVRCGRVDLDLERVDDLLALAVPAHRQTKGNATYANKICLLVVAEVILDLLDLRIELLCVELDVHLHFIRDEPAHYFDIR